MPRPRKPTTVLAFTGAYKKNPKRRKEREGEPEVTDPLGDPPEYLFPGAKVAWKEIAAIATWLVSADRWILEVIAVLLARHRDPFGAHELVRGGLLQPAEIGHLRNGLGQLGLTPADRSKVKVPERPRKSPFDGLKRGA